MNNHTQCEVFEIDKCYFCGDSNISDKDDRYNLFGPGYIKYNCKKCRVVCLDTTSDNPLPYTTRINNSFKDEDKKILSMLLRNRYEDNIKNNETELYRKLSIEDLKKMYESYKVKDSIELINNALLRLDKRTNYVGEQITLNIHDDYHLFYCLDAGHMIPFFRLIHDSKLIIMHINSIWLDINITYNGYNKLAELKTKGEGKQCFVAMWFNDDMKIAYDSIIKAVEYIEEGQEKPKYKAFRIDNKAHNNNINNEIIAEIRRSKFMVCDLTGYRGGVYFEAGFAYGLGLEVIYTCRKYWTKELVTTYYDEDHNPVEVRREGVHFDLAHTNRIEWEEDKLAEFEEALKQQIRATVV